MRLSRALAYYSLRPAVRLGLSLAGGVRVEGEERVPLAGGLVVASNHLSLADAVVLQACVPRILTYLMGEKFYHVPGIHQFVRFWGVLIVRERGMSKDALRAAGEVLAAGGAVGVFPEGGISRDGRVRPAQPGAALIAQRAGVPILPVGLAGTERLLPPGSARLHRARLGICFGEPVIPCREPRQALAGRLTAALRACAERARQL